MPDRVYVVLRVEGGWCCGHHHKSIRTAIACRAKQPSKPENWLHRWWDFYVQPVTRKDVRLPKTNADHKALGTYHFLKAVDRLPEKELGA